MGIEVRQLQAILARIDPIRIRFGSESHAAALWYPRYPIRDPIRYPIRYPLLPLLLSQVQQHLLLQVILSVVDGNGIVVTSACSISLG